MDAIVTALGQQQDELAGYVVGLDEADLSAPSRCPGWSVADVLLHLAQTNEMAVASCQGRLGDAVDRLAAGLGSIGSVDDWAGAMVDKERGSATEARDRWVASATDQVVAFAACDPRDRVLWVAGDMAARSLATTRLTETWIHTVDAAVAYGAAPAPTDRLWHTARLVWRTVPYALDRGGHQQQGSVAFVLEAPDGTTWTFEDGPGTPTVIRGSALDLCSVAGQRAEAGETGLTGEGPDAEAVLRLMRTFA